RRRRIPEELCVVVRVRVDEAGRDDHVAGVDRLVGVFIDLADRDDAAVANADIGALTGCPGAVDDGAAPDHGIEHDVLLSGLCASSCAGRRVAWRRRRPSLGGPAVRRRAWRPWPRAAARAWPRALLCRP